jgi:hypothetical protein
MGNSFLSYWDAVVGIRDSDMGLICAVLAGEVGALPGASPQRAVMLPLQTEIMDRGYCLGDAKFVGLEQFFHSREELDTAAAFVRSVITKISAFGILVPNTYLATLPFGESYQKQTWQVSWLVEPLTRLEEMLKAQQPR